MTNKTQPNINITPGISYQPYSALIVHMDMREVSKSTEDPSRLLMKNNDAWAKECARYRIGVIGNAIDWAMANGDEHELPGIVKLEPYLFNPACFIAFGKTDAIGIVLIDDFEPSIRLTSSIGVDVQQSCMAFCPTLHSLDLDSTDEDKRHFIDLKDICQPSKAEEDGAGETPEKKTYQMIEDELLKKSVPEAYKPRQWKNYIDEINNNVVAPTLPAIKDKPLIAVVYFKLHGMAILGPGLLMQQAVYKTMAERIKLKLREMREGNYEEIGVTEPAINSFQCIFLDPQGWADMATIMFCKNYSVMMSVVDALRGITFGELYDEEPALEDAIRAFRINEKSTGDQKSLMPRTSHVFWSTYTTLGMTNEAFNEAHKEKDTKHSCNGVVVAETKLNLYAGHQELAHYAARGSYLATEDACERLINSYTWAILGSDDSIYEDLVRDDHNYNGRVIKLCCFIKQFKVKLCHTTEQGDKFTKHLLNFYSDLRIPTIKNMNSISIDSKHMLYPQMLMEHLAKVFKSGGKFPPEKLWDSARMLRVPTPLCSAIRYLYEDYTAHVSDSFLFERVLDLYDIFAAVYLLITKELPDSLDKLYPLEQRTDSQCRSFLTESDIKGLVEVIALMRGALDSRVQGAFPEVEKWSHTIDVQGCGFGRWIHAVDVPFRCWLSVLRDVRCGWAPEAYKPSEEEKKLFKEKEPPRIGGTSRISHDPRSQLSRITIGNIDSICLASVNLNFTHFTRPSAFCIYFHEVAHLICDKIREKDNYGIHDTLTRELNRVFTEIQFTPEEQDDYISAIAESCCDIFPEMIVHQLVFAGRDDFVTYFRNYMVNYSLEPKAHIQDENDARVRMFAMLMRGFLITDPFRVKHPKYSATEDKHIYDQPSKKIKDIVEIAHRAFERFDVSVRDAGHFYFDFRGLWPDANNKKGQEGIRQQFYQSYREMYPLICYMWSKTKELMRGICKGCENKPGREPPDEYKRVIQQQIQDGLSQGQPLSRMLFEIPERESQDERYRFLSSTYMLNQVVKEHIKGLFGKKTIDDPAKLSVCLLRDRKDGYPCYVANKPYDNRANWHFQLIDRNSNRVFTVTPKAREDYMKSRIAVVKTLWDISTNLRARRMKDMLSLAKR